MAYLTTNSFNDIRNALEKRLTSQGYALHSSQLVTLTLDVADTIKTDGASIVADASTELTAHPKRPFIFGV